MTFLTRSIQRSPALDNALEPHRKKNNSFESIERLSSLLRISPMNADYLWARGQIRLRFARQQLSGEEFRRALDDFGESLLIDPTPVRSYPDVLPQHEWAYPAYRKVLEKCLLDHKVWMTKLNRPNLIWVASPAIQLAEKIAIAIANNRLKDDSIVESLLPFTQFAPTLSQCPFRKALASAGWLPQRSGFALITQLDIDFPDKYDNELRDNASTLAFYDLLKDAAISEVEFSKLQNLFDEATARNVDELFDIVQTSGGFRRAIGSFVLRLLEHRMHIEQYATDLAQQHRFIRLVAVGAIGERLCELDTNLGRDEFDAGVKHLVRVATSDKAQGCRRNAVVHLGRLASKIIASKNVELHTLCVRVIEDCIAAKQRPLVLSAIRSARSFGKLKDATLHSLTDLSFEKRHRFDCEDHEWQLICEKATTVLLQAPIESDLASNALDALTGLISQSNHAIRLEAVRAASLVIKQTPTYLGKLRTQLLERSWIDDCKEVRMISKQLVENCH